MQNVLNVEKIKIKAYESAKEKITLEGLTATFDGEAIDPKKMTNFRVLDFMKKLTA